MSISLENVTALPMENLKIHKLSDEEIAEMQKRTAQLYLSPDVPEVGDYAKIYDNRGKVIATVDNNGGVTSSNAQGRRIQSMLKNVGIGLEGPALAEARTEALEDFFDGDAVQLDSAMTQQEWDHRDPVTWDIDTTSLARHGYDVSGLNGEDYASKGLALETVMALFQSDPE